MRVSPQYSPKVQARAVQMAFEHLSEHDSQCAAMLSIGARFGCMPEFFAALAVTGRA